MSQVTDEPIAATIRRVGVVAILRGVASTELLPLAHTLVENGVPLIEVALSTAGALNQLAALIADMGGDAVIGAGTVTSEALAEAALGAGARFLVTPHVVPEVSTLGRRQGVEVLGGALTSTEIVAARAQGNTFIKIFPAGPLGPGYLSALLGPYPDAELVPVGGIDATNAEAFIRAGAIAIGVGGALTSLRGGFDEAHVAALAQALLAAVQRGRAVLA